MCQVSFICIHLRHSCVVALVLIFFCLIFILFFLLWSFPVFPRHERKTCTPTTLYNQRQLCRASRFMRASFGILYSCRYSWHLVASNLCLSHPPMPIHFARELQSKCTSYMLTQL
nr:uncharacterized protein CTRU02_14102 [Colletotrichum truncatum]KAF6782621.1 hypothetical protein CTRU02_14102 [Colletotrichum truncatum]